MAIFFPVLLFLCWFLLLFFFFPLEMEEKMEMMRKEKGMKSSSYYHVTFRSHWRHHRAWSTIFRMEVKLWSGWTLLCSGSSQQPAVKVRGSQNMLGFINNRLLKPTSTSTSCLLETASDIHNELLRHFYCFSQKKSHRKKHPSCYFQAFWINEGWMFLSAFKFEPPTGKKLQIW